MKLWSGVLSPFSTKVRIVLAEKGLEYETLQIPWTRQTLWGPKPPEFLAVSPHGKVPVLIDGEATVYDSTVIAEYLEDRYPEPSLFPANAVARARCRQLEDEADTAMVEEVTPLVQELFTQRDETARDHARLRAAIAALHCQAARAEDPSDAGLVFITRDGLGDQVGATPCRPSQIT